MGMGLLTRLLSPERLKSTGFDINPINPAHTVSILFSISAMLQVVFVPVGVSVIPPSCLTSPFLWFSIILCPDHFRY